MREQKFKIWIPYANNGKGIMMQPLRIQTIHEIILGGVTSGQMKQWIYLQYTGRKDQNGTEIYEKDIVEVYGDLRVVEFKHAFWMFEKIELEGVLGGFVTETESGAKPLYRYAEKTIIIRGNVFEHPELIRKP